MIERLEANGAPVQSGGRRADDAEAAFERSWFERLANSVAGLGFWRLDIAARRLIWSDEIFRIYGLEPGQSPPFHTARRAIHPDDAPAARTRLKRALAQGEDWSDAQMRIVRPNGEVRHTEGRGFCARGPDGVTAAIFGVLIDTTGRRRAELVAQSAQAQHKAKSALFENAFEHAAVGKALVGLDGRFMRVNAAFCDLVGYPAEQLLSLDFQTITYPQDLNADLGLLDQLLSGAIPSYWMDKRYVRADGRIVWVHLTVSMVSTAQGRPHYFIAQVQDLSARIALEAELRQARAAAEAAVEVKSEFLANMSHELRTPLTSIVGFTNLVREQGELSALTRSYVERVSDASQALLCTVNDILDFSKLEAGQVSIQPQPTQTEKLGQATLELFAPQAAAKDLVLAFENRLPSALRLAIDPDRLRQVLLNLVGNAVKFTKSGGVTLQMGWDEASARLLVDVIDTGDGVAPSLHDRLFQRFSQIDGSLTRNKGGTGLGLAICKGIVEAMGGEIGVESQIGLGSRFWFSLPAPMCAGAAMADPIVGVRPSSLEGVRVLVVDDHAANRELARLYLTGVGAEISEASDGAEAVASALSLPFDVILMDLNMPGLDGATALARIRAIDGPNDVTPIIALTAEVGAAAKARMAALGFQDVVGKPLEAGALVAAIAGVAAFAPAPAPAATADWS